MKRNSILLGALCVVILLLSSCRTTQRLQVLPPSEAEIRHPKREFRGAWISTAWQSRYKEMNSEQMKQYFSRALDELQAVGINAVIFQARPHADAFYQSGIEPWSALLTGTQGKAPDNGFDPLAYLVEECHKRNMELHAWLNPYRVTAGVNDVLAPNHLYYREPQRFVTYGGKIYFDPGLPENEAYICRIVKDIVARYDVDAIHMDDYFYPYPVAGEAFPDDASFARYAAAQGFGAEQRADWRRNNVNKLVREIKYTIAATKPWVRFGISPFGIYRNKKNTPDGSGSDTNGLQNYDDLYADVLLWAKEGWIDYNMPQLYWEIGHPAADYETLIRWWSNKRDDSHLYIGQDVKRTMDATQPSGESQLEQKMVLARRMSGGSCFWPAYELLDDYKEVSTDLLLNYYRYPALIPAYTHMHGRAPKKVKKIWEEYTEKEHLLRWTADVDPSDPEKAKYYVVYRFAKSEKENTDDASRIVSITRQPQYVLPYEGGRGSEYKYVVTAVDAFHNESKGRTKKVKL
ncbi:glycoside hydrolase family 10 protein [Dysgonomonas sp. 25]|uniref:glycoside hydrolase family 10 protein n=1 Tax=Dysgonomonas sp. 25 TaxID=2302933 RepID=UPI0013D68590|nr:family 10 glycosylhydrolase [Dysgonomonas sp. 25]NDV69207.1 hypothetical protein [Dysgonomonas sp. 25]